MFDLLFAVFIAYAAVAASIFILQRKMMYHPNTHIGAPEQYGLRGVEDNALVSQDNTPLQAWVHKAREGFPTIVYFHGNAGNLGDRSAKFRAFIDAGFGLVAVSYRGYGKSLGAPNEQGIYADARAAIAYAQNTLQVPFSKLIFFGESLGSGVAVEMATQYTPALLMLEAAYTSVETRSAELFPYVLFARKLVRDKYDSLAKIADVKAPLLMIHGTLDSTIPLAHGKKLFAAAREPKSMIVYPEVHHVDFTNDQIITPLLNASRHYKLI